MNSNRKVNDGLDRWEQLAQELLGEEAVAPQILPVPDPEPEPPIEAAVPEDLPQSAAFTEAVDECDEGEDGYSTMEEFAEPPTVLEGDNVADDEVVPQEPPLEKERRGGRRGRRGRGRGRRGGGRGQADEAAPARREAEEEPIEPTEPAEHPEVFDEFPAGFGDLIGEELAPDDSEDVEETAEDAAAGIPTWAEAISYLKILPAEGGGGYDRGSNGGRSRRGPRRRGGRRPS